MNTSKASEKQNVTSALMSFVYQWNVRTVMPNGNKVIKLCYSDKRWDARIDLMNFCKKNNNQ